MITKLFERLFQGLAQQLLRHKYVFFAVTVGITLISGYFASQIKLDPKFTSLLAKDHPVVKNLDKISKIYVFNYHNILHLH